MNAEIIRDMPDEEYFAIDAVNASTLKRMTNPEKCQYDSNHQKKSEAMQFGTDFHNFVLRGIMPNEDPNMVVCPFKDYRTKEAKEWKAEHEGAGHRILTQKEERDLDGYTDELGEMAETVYDIPEYMEQHNNSEKEVVILWDKITLGGHRIKCKAKLDLLNLGHADYGYDLKTCADLASFDRDCLKYGYYISAAWYCEAMRELLGEVRGFKFIVAGKALPHQATMRELPADILELGYLECDNLADTWARCKEKDIWPSPYSKESQMIEVSYWFRKEKGLV